MGLSSGLGVRQAYIAERVNSATPGHGIALIDSKREKTHKVYWTNVGQTQKGIDQPLGAVFNENALVLGKRDEFGK